MHHITYSEHSIPSFDVMALTDSSIFYTFNNNLFLYDLLTSTTTLLLADFSADRLFYSKGRLYSLKNTELKRFTVLNTLLYSNMTCDTNQSNDDLQGINKLTTVTGNMKNLQDTTNNQHTVNKQLISLTSTYTLSHSPVNIISNSDALYFISENILQVFTFSDSKLQTIPIEETIIDMAFSNDTAYILLRNNKIVREKDPRLTGFLMLRRYLRYITPAYKPVRLNDLPSGKNTARSISVYNNEIILGYDMEIVKYSLVNNTLIQKYSLESPGVVQYGLLISDVLVELGSAPYTLLNDRIRMIHQCEDESVMACSSNRVYFIRSIRENSCPGSLTPAGTKGRVRVTDYEENDDYNYREYVMLMSSGNSRVVGLPRELEFLSGAEGERVKELLGEIERWKGIERVLREKREKQRVKTEELKNIREEVTRMAEKCNERAIRLRENIVELKRRAEMVDKEGDVSEFKKKLVRLGELLDNMKVMNKEEYVRKLKAQRVVLQDIIL